MVDSSDERYLDYARKLYAEWKASDFKGSFDDNHPPTEKDIMLNFAEWIVKEKSKSAPEKVEESHDEDEFYNVGEWIDATFTGGADSGMMKSFARKEFEKRGITMDASVKDIDPNILHRIMLWCGVGGTGNE